MINIEFEAFKETPTIEVTAIAPTAEEAIFFTSHVPEIFTNYLVVEEVNKQHLEYENTLTLIDNVKTALFQAENELIIASRETVNQVENDSTYVALNSEIAALERELERLAAELSESIIRGDDAGLKERQQREYQEILQKAQERSLARSEAVRALRELENQWFLENDIRNTQPYIELNSKISALELQLDISMTEMAILIGDDEPDAEISKVQRKVERLGAAIVKARDELTILESQWNTESLEENLDYQLGQAKVANLDMEIFALRERLVSLVNESALEEYEQDIQASFKKIGAALAGARTELATLENQWSGESLAQNLNYQIAQTMADNLNRELVLLNDRLSALLVSSGGGSEEIDFLAVGNPSMPIPVITIRLRTALMMGAVVGVVLAWVALNFRWLAKVGSSSPEDEEDEA
jgi:hypothetical protein